MTNLTMVRQGKFGNAECDFWLNNDNQDILVTREQVGQALQYANPSDAIKNIHKRNAERLDQFSVKLKMSGTDKKLYSTYLYTAKGLYEICRFSNQPKANEFIDWVWDIVEDIRKNGYSQPEALHPFVAYMNESGEELQKILSTMPVGLSTQQMAEWYHVNVYLPKELAYEGRKPRKKPKYA